ncbi:DUF1513 domain-containing protein [Agarivorans sp.]|uniref:DUF1513 domain-containing protein n=1 Tax=Agarivorans sp. TaxID=1872412 RepID=UPI003D0360B3
MQRRQFLKGMGLLGLGAGSLSLSRLAAALGSEQTLAEDYLLIACAKQQQQHYLAAANAQGEVVYRLPLPARGHDVALAKPEQQLGICVARRPGDFAQLFNPLSGEALALLSPPDNMHFYGHACFSEDAQQIYLTAGSAQTSQGWVLVYQRQQQQWQLAEQWPLDGLGPHQLLLLPGKRLVVAVGGIHTQGREKLNLDSMQPALVYLHSETGQHLLTRSLSNSKLSIRHLAYSPQSDSVWLACQGQDPQQQPESLIYSQQGQGECVALDPHADYWPMFDQYIGSIICHQGQVLASSPRAGKLAAWSEQQGELEQLMQYDDVCGLAQTADAWHASTGQGLLIHQASDLSRQRTQLQWDNHMALLSLS